MMVITHSAAAKAHRAVAFAVLWPCCCCCCWLFGRASANQQAGQSGMKMHSSRVQRCLEQAVQAGPCMAHAYDRLWVAGSAPLSLSLSLCAAGSNDDLEEQVLVEEHSMKAGSLPTTTSAPLNVMSSASRMFTVTAPTMPARPRPNTNNITMTTSGTMLASSAPLNSSGTSRFSMPMGRPSGSAGGPAGPNMTVPSPPTSAGGAGPMTRGSMDDSDAVFTVLG